MIKKVTVTGADDTTDIHEMISLQKEFNFLEYAILVMQGRVSTRFPTKKWIKALKGKELNLSLHMCGNYVNEFLLGDASFIYTELSDVWDMFSRVQINTHGIKHETNLPKLYELITLFPDKEFIFQWDNKNTEILESLMDKGVKNISALSDLSHGAGILPDKWPKPLFGIKCGYAGGLSADNVKEQMDNIIESIGYDNDIWIDAETHLRSISHYTNGDIFDLKKVRSFLINSEEFVY